jgi:hypothetical protein
VVAADLWVLGGHRAVGDRGALVGQAGANARVGGAGDSGEAEVDGGPPQAVSPHRHFDRARPAHLSWIGAERQDQFKTFPVRCRTSELNQGETFRSAKHRTQ